MLLEDLPPQDWLAHHGLWAGLRSYDDEAKRWLKKSGHYLDAPPPGALFAIALCPLVPGLFGPVPSNEIVGLAVIGRPIARNLPQDGSWVEITRFALDPNIQLPKGTASRLLRVTFDAFARRPRAASMISYHDRSRHSGCIYKKAGFKKDGVTRAGTRRGTWMSRPGREQGASSEVASKRRWRRDVTPRTV